MVLGIKSGPRVRHSSKTKKQCSFFLFFLRHKRRLLVPIRTLQECDQSKHFTIFARESGARGSHSRLSLKLVRIEVDYSISILSKPVSLI